MAKVKTFETPELIIKIDQSACISCGTCEALAPKTFELDKNLKSQVKANGPYDKKDEVVNAAQSCAVDAITIIDKKSGQKLWPN